VQQLSLAAGLHLHALYETVQISPDSTVALRKEIWVGWKRDAIR